jgi:hypothetical protein
LGLVVQTVLTATGQMGTSGAVWITGAVVFVTAILLPLNLDPVTQTLLASAVSAVAAAVGICLLAWWGRPRAHSPEAQPAPLEYT